MIFGYAHVVLWRGVTILRTALPGAVVASSRLV
jgi:hypothetical protein